MCWVKKSQKLQNQKEIRLLKFHLTNPANRNRHRWWSLVSKMLSLSKLTLCSWKDPLLFRTTIVLWKPTLFGGSMENLLRKSFYDVVCFNVMPLLILCTNCPFLWLTKNSWLSDLVFCQKYLSGNFYCGNFTHLNQWAVADTLLVALIFTHHQPQSGYCWQIDRLRQKCPSWCSHMILAWSERSKTLISHKRLWK